MSRSRFGNTYGMTRVVALAVVVLLTASAGVAATAGRQSWYDANRGWRVVGLRIDATENGGATWQTIRREDGISVDAVLRTGIRTGLFVEGNSFDTVWWLTNDGGRHWASTRALSAYRTPIGSGSFLFMYSSSDIVRVTPWPPLGAANGRPPRLRNQRLLRTAQGNLAGAALVPGGVLIAYYAKRSAGNEPRARVVRYGRGGAAAATDRRLPASEPLGPCVLPSSGRLLGVQWPILTIPACRGTIAAGHWLSLNGGRNWRLTP